MAARHLAWHTGMRTGENSSEGYLAGSFWSDAPGGDLDVPWPWAGIFGKAAPLKRQTLGHMGKFSFDLTHLRGGQVGGDLDWLQETGF